MNVDWGGYLRLIETDAQWGRLHASNQSSRSAASDASNWLLPGDHAGVFEPAAQAARARSPSLMFLNLVLLALPGIATNSARSGVHRDD